MARIIYSQRALDDLERLVDFLFDDDPNVALQTVDLIQEAISLLEHHPLIGRPVKNELRELVISRGNTGYVGLYSFEEIDDVILVLAIRHHREAGYQD
ncbi:type II toxin-antitoxin system RelE/ParE family toxin [Undibacterium fentianense]|uniref:Type II toxin-antitoxin system RelE/ParE family toxin n=1 Tax=Undibacterium fentianense TaxID=2828728 RepID=A0A941E0Q3_9BURK|nr:type II toxin-antitoxin system RelE/ParE family toxin [Undibacterium fentianense]MBR7800225.1 type II toxin-antitoxin system RelE/ParE family toxin [Undibacterium fentianense]